MEGLVTISEVKKAYNELGKHSIKRLINEMEALDQGKIQKDKLEEAKLANECNVCHKVIPEGKSMCRDCEREERERLAENELDNKFEGLKDALNKFAGSEVYKVVKGGYQTIIRRDVCDEYCEIYRDGISHRGGWSIYKHALRIRTSDYSIKAKGLQKDFGDKNVAKNLHERCNKLLEEIGAKRLRYLAKQKKEENVDKGIRRDFPEVDEEGYKNGIAPYGYKSGNKYIQTSSRRVDLGTVMEGAGTIRVFASIILPLTFVTGIYGMNFEWMPFLHSKYGFWVSLGVMGGIGLLLLEFFRRKKWF